MSFYRILTFEELEVLKPEFINFLASQGITADTWQKWLVSEPVNCEQLIQAFSEFIFFSILEKTRFLIRSFSGSTQFIRVNENSFDMLWFKAVINLHEMQNNVESKWYQKGKDIDVFAGKKLFKNPEKSEIFSLLSEGYRPIKSEELAGVANLFEEYENFFLTNNKIT